MTVLQDFPPGLLAVPAQETLWSESAVAIVALAHWLPQGSEMTFMLGSHSIAFKRNSLVKTLLRKPALQWCLFLDSDAVPLHDTALQLLRHEVDIVAATFCLRKAPYAEAHGDAIGVGPNELIEVPDVGTHCLLVRRHVLETMSEPWFDHGTSPGVGEDTFFCEAARAAGFRLYVDPTVHVGHITVQNVTPSFAREYQATPAGATELARAHARSAAWRAARMKEAAP